MNKIAIMTWFHYNNFGTALQVYALSEILKQMEYEPSVINYIPNDKKMWTLKDILKDPFAFSNKVLTKIKEMLNLTTYQDTQRGVVFDDFLKQYIKLTDRCYTSSQLHALNKLFDTFICGSDQIWNPTNYNSKYFLDFVNDNSKMIAYAPSMGVCSITDNNIKNQMVKQLQRFKYLSVRENEGSKIIKKLTGQNAPVLLDPTLLLSKGSWNSLKSTRLDLKSFKKPYLLCYFLGNSVEHWKSAYRISKKLNLEIVVIAVHPKDRNRVFKVVEAVGPIEFLELLSDASFVCTDSFHGTAFSIINEKPFIVYKRFSDSNKNSQNSRIYSILENLGLESLLYFGNDRASIENAKNIDYQSVNKLLNEERQKSIDFLQKSIKASMQSEPSSVSITNTCCGCGVCKAVCTQSAITLEINEKGFLQAHIDNSKCLKCMKCISVCPFNGEPLMPIDNEQTKLFMGQSESKDVLEKSSSGGIGYELAKYCCEQGYDVIGCVYNKENKIAKHIRIKEGNTSQLSVFQGSKYLQSHFDNCVKNIIDSHKAIIFGTPCQIAGTDKLLRYKGMRDNFILVDLICHGVPSDILWTKYLEEKYEKYKIGETPSVDFRYKLDSWQERNIKISNGDRAYVGKDTKDEFYRFYKAGNCLSDCCYECNYRNSACSDIRLGDYWGNNYKNSGNGASMVLSLTKKGKSLLASLQDDNRIELIENKIDDYWNIQMPYNSKKPIFYDQLLADLKDNEYTLENLANKYCRPYEQSKKLYKIVGQLRILLRSLEKR